MDIFNDEIRLPGVITKVEADYSFGFDPSAFGTTDSVVVIGTAFNGPVGAPTPVYSVEHAAYIFGAVYDSETRQEANLVAGVQDAWDRGCRTIYAVRVGGKEIFKDFDFCIDSKYKLRVSSQFPSNTAKDCYFAYDNSVDAEAITFYKPAERATIAEKRAGAVVNRKSVLKSTLKINQDYGLRREDRLIDLINVFNKHPKNNVLKLTIVDQDGTDVTSSPEVYDIAIGAIHPGAYFIGRDRSHVEERTELSFQITNQASSRPYENIKEAYFRTLEFNTDITMPYPIYANVKNKKEFKKILHDVGILMTNDWDFLDIPGVVERAFAKDKQDYEETSLSKFEIYKRLGSGFAITAKASPRKKGDEIIKDATPRIAETSAGDPNRIQPIVEGIYSMLEDAEIKYRALVCAAAEDKIASKLPRPADFKKATPNEINIVEDYITLIPKINKKDFTDAKKYTIKLQEADNTALKTNEQIYTKEVFPVVAKFDGDEAKLRKKAKEGAYENGQLLIVTDGTLFRVNGDNVKALNGVAYAGKHFIVNDQILVGEGADKEVKFTNPEAKCTGGKYDEKDYVLGSTLDAVFMFGIKEDKLVPMGDFKSIYNTEGEEASFVAYAESLPEKENTILLRSSLFENITLSELVEAINEHEVLNKLFEAKIAETGYEHKDEMVDELFQLSKAPEKTKEAGKTEADRTIGYDYELYIPYRTNDNFVRQLAQHCTYTELKTTPAFGFIGCKRLINTGLSNIAAKVNELAEANFDLYAKTSTGRNMLDRHNLPYPIGKNVNLVFSQYPVSMQASGYQFISNAAAGYAGMVSTLPLEQSSTCQRIEIESVDFACSQAQLKQLTAAGIVTIRKSFNKGLVITDGITMAPIDSVYRRLSSSRITGAVEELIRQAAEPFLGKENHTANRNALTTAIKSVLDKITGTLIEEFDFVLNNDPQLLKYNAIDIAYKIVPIYEIREINNTIKIVDRISSGS